MTVFAAFFSLQSNRLTGLPYTISIFRAIDRALEALTKPLNWHETSW
jgi:hypothetical protein